jgi:hypothetical protein
MTLFKGWKNKRQIVVNWRVGSKWFIYDGVIIDGIFYAYAQLEKYRRESEEQQDEPK